MQLAVSNLAWSADCEDEALELVAEAGFRGIEVAPTKIADWSSLDTGKLETYRRKCEVLGLQVSSLQAIFFNCPGAQLLGDDEGFDEMLSQTRRVADIASILGAGVAVYGAPNSRRRGTLSVDEANRIAVDRLRKLGDITGPKGLTLGMEPVPTYYGADFATDVDQMAKLVEVCDHPAIGLHLDCACIQLAGTDAVHAVSVYGGRAVHYHAAEPDLRSFAAPECDHAAIARSLASSGYDRWISIEMRQQDGNGLAALRGALSFVHQAYGNA